MSFIAQSTFGPTNIGASLTQVLSHTFAAATDDAEVRLALSLGGATSRDITLAVTLSGDTIETVTEPQGIADARLNQDAEHFVCDTTLVLLSRRIGTVTAGQVLKVLVKSSNAGDANVYGGVSLWGKTYAEITSRFGSGLTGSGTSTLTDWLRALCRIDVAAPTSLNTGGGAFDPGAHSLESAGQLLADVGDAVAITNNRLGPIAGSSNNTVLGMLRAVSRSDAPTPGDLGGTFAPATDSLQAIRDRGDAAWTGGGDLGGSLNVALTVTADGDPVPLCRVTVRDVTDSTILAVKVTDDNGLVTLHPLSGVGYKITLSAPGHAEFANPYARTWNADGSDTIDGIATAVTPPPSPDYCTCAVFPEAAPVAGDFTAELVSVPDAFNGVAVYASARPFAIVDQHFELPLIRGAEYRIRSTSYALDRALIVPDADSCNVMQELAIP